MTTNNNRDHQDDPQESVHDHNGQQHDEETGAAIKHSSEPDLEPEAEQPAKPSFFDQLRANYAQARVGRNAKSTDRSKAMLALAITAFVVLFAVIAMMSHSINNAGEARRTKPSLGRPEAPANTRKENRGSLTPLQNADVSNQNDNGDQDISQDDVHNTRRMRLQRGSPANENEPTTLARVPPMDPALEEYQRRAKGSYAAPAEFPAPPVSTTPVASAAVPTTPASKEAEGLKKPSLVFIRSDVNGSAAAYIRPASLSTNQSALLERRGGGRLPKGSRLVARLQAAASTAVKVPVVAAIEYNYEKNGEIIIPAGTKAFGELLQASRNGIVSLRFHSLETPDGTTEKIDGAGMSLEYGPLKGSVNGSNRAKRLLVQTLTGMGSTAAFLVGGPGGLSGASGALDNSVLLRERIASNAGLAGDQALTSLATNEQIVVTVPANTRFFIVLQDAGGEPLPSRLIHSGTQGLTTQYASRATSALPTAQELRELIDLKSEINRMYQQAAVTRTSEPATAAQEATTALPAAQ